MIVQKPDAMVHRSHQLDCYKPRFRLMIEEIFGLKLDDNILLNEAEVELIENESKLNYATKSLRLLTMFTGLHIGADQDARPAQFFGPSKTLRFHNPFESKLACCNFNAKLAFGLNLVAIPLALINFVTLAYHDLLVVRLYKKGLSKRDTLDDPILDCATGSGDYDDNYMSPHLHSAQSKLLNVDLLLESTATPGSTVLVFAMFCYGYLMLGSLALLMLALYYFDRETPIDSLNYILNPTSECHRLKKELCNLITKVKIQAKNFYCFREAAFGKLTRNSNNNNNETKLGQLATGNLYLEQLVEFNEMLDIIKENNLVRPRTFCISVLKRTAIVWRLEGLLILMVVSCVAVLPIAFFLSDAYSKTDARLRQAVCHDWNPTSVFVRHHVHLNLSSPSERIDLTGYDGSIISRLILMVQFELLRMLSWRSIAQISLGMFLIVYLSMWTCFYFSLIFPGATMSMAWIDQLGEQLDACLKIIDRPMELLGAGSSEILHGNIHSNVDEFILTITATYLNFELFRKEQEKLLKIFDHCSSVIALTTGSATLLAVVIERYIATLRSTTLVVIMLENLIVMNLFFVQVIRMTYAVSKLYKKIFKLLARASICELELHHATDLWRRQLFDRRKMVEFFAPKVLGLQFSRATLISSNLYTVAFLLFVLFSSS